MLKRLLASLAIVSLLIAVTVLVYWWRADHGHIDTLSLGRIGSTQSKFSTGTNGRVAVEAIEYQGSIVQSQMRFYTFKNILGCCFVIPGFWVAIKVRSLLPRPPGMGRNAEVRMQNAERKSKKKI